MGIISWTGTVSSIIGSFLVAFQIYIWGYIFFILGSICWLGIGIMRRDKSLSVLNGFFLTANFIGIIGVLS
jgi:hypothetical protein